MRKGFLLNLNLRVLSVLFLLHCLHQTFCSQVQYLNHLRIMASSADEIFPKSSATGVPQPLLPLLAPTPSASFSNSSLPKLSGRCSLNFTAAESMMSETSTDCLSDFAPYLADVVCCPQVEAALVILLGQYSKESDSLALNKSLSMHCLSDVEKILASRGASGDLRKICSVQQLNLTEGTCPVKNIDDFERIVDSSRLLDACENMNPVKECCDQSCENAISEASTRIASRSYDTSIFGSLHGLHSDKVTGCRSIVLRWLASRLGPRQAKKVIRGLSNCKVNKGCPLVFPSVSHVAKACGIGTDNRTTCCGAIGKYMPSLQNQSFVTNLQALNCAASLGRKLQKANVTENVYGLCRITLKDFSVQAAANEATFGVQSGCLLQSLPTDVTLDKSSGVSFLCDLNDNIPAIWPTASQLSSFSCNRNVQIPALPVVASAQSGLNDKLAVLSLFSACVLALMAAAK